MQCFRYYGNSTTVTDAQTNAGISWEEFHKAVQARHSIGSSGLELSAASTGGSIQADWA